MKNWLKETNSLLLSAHEQLLDRQLSNWNAFIKQEGLMHQLRVFLPQGVGMQMIFASEEVRPQGLHHFGCRDLYESLTTTDSEARVLISGSMDTTQETGYQNLYHEKGWRTVIYLMMDVKHSTDPKQHQSQPDMTADNPLILYSEKAHALTPGEIHRIYLATRYLFSTMLLRLGLTLVNNSYERMKTVVHGALLTITHEMILDVNNEAEEWFGSDIKTYGGRPIEEVFPGPLKDWVLKNINAGTTRDVPFVSRVLDLTRYDGSKVHAEVTLRRTGSFENIEINERMRMGSNRAPLKEVSEKMHYLLIQDVTDRWETERIQQEMELARRMQINLLPGKMPVSDTLKIAARCLPASQVGGDVYDVYKLNDDRLAVFVGDAVGHGVDSGLLAATTMGAYRAVIDNIQQPSQVLAELDKTLRQSDQTGFITASCLLFSTNGRELDYALAGQPYPLIVRRGKLIDPDDTPSSLPLGVNLPASYSSGSYQLEPGDLVALVSDGVIELLNEEEEPFAAEFEKCLQSNSSEDVLKILDLIFQTIDDFRGEIEQADDLTVVMIRVC